MGKRLATVGAVAALAVGAATAVVNVGAADHLDAPLVALDGRTDINDVYVFTSTENPDNTVLIMTVNPGAGVISGTDFDDDANYQFYVDTDLDARHDFTYTVRSRTRANGTQAVSVHDTRGRLRPGTVDRGAVGDTIDLTNGGKLTAGVFDDPFFFDLVGFQNGFDFTGDDFFAGLDVSAIVLEVPTSELGADGDLIAVHAGTRTRGQGSRQIDRMGRPAINTVLLPSGLKDDFNRVWPHRQKAKFRDTVVGTLKGLGNDQARAEALADVLLPDLNTFVLGDDSGFLNGRQLADDVIDAELALLSNGAVTGDGVDANDREFSVSFPYLATANGSSTTP